MLLSSGIISLMIVKYILDALFQLGQVDNQSCVMTLTGLLDSRKEKRSLFTVLIWPKAVKKRVLSECMNLTELQDSSNKEVFILGLTLTE